jgi:hypothetical protein
MKIDAMERIAEEKEQSLHHVQALINALGDPSKWEYRDEMNDTGSMNSRCACGHAIRYEFIIYSPEGKTAILGSTCIENFSQFNPESAARMKKDYETFMEKVKAELKEQKEKLASEEVEKAKSEFEPVYAEFKKYIDAKRSPNGYLPYDVYHTYNYAFYEHNKIKNFKRKITMVKKYKELTEYCKRALGVN